VPVNKQFSEDILNHFAKRKIIGIRNGERHRFIGLWPIVVEGRIFVRSWAQKKEGWYEAFGKNPLGMIQFEEKEINIKTRKVTSERINKLISENYREKFNTPGARKYVKDLTGRKCVGATVELLPA